MESRTIGARPAHVIVGLQQPVYGFLHGVDAMTGKTAAVALQADGSQGEPLQGESLPALCQWDDSRGLFFLDSKMSVSDSQTPMELEGKWAVSWRSALHSVMSAWPLGSKSSIEAKLWGNFKNVVEIAGVDEAMFYLAAVSLDMVTAGKSKKMSSSRLFEAMIRDYSLVDPQQYGLDAVDAAAVKTYGQPRLSDVSLRDDGRGDWRAWEDELKEMGLPSSAWLPWRRIRSRIGEVQPELAGSVLASLNPGLTDYVSKLPLGEPGTVDYCETVSRWVVPSPVDWRLRRQWLEELLSVGVWIAVSEGSMWSEALGKRTGLSKADSELLHELADSTVDRQLGFVAALWKCLHSKLSTMPADGGEEALEKLAMADEQLALGLSVVDMALADSEADEYAGTGETASTTASRETPDDSEKTNETSRPKSATKTSPRSSEQGGKTESDGKPERSRTRKPSSKTEETEDTNAPHALSKKPAGGDGPDVSDDGEAEVKKPTVRKPKPVSDDGMIDYEMDVVTSDDLDG